MDSWFTYLKHGLSRTLPDDRIPGQEGYANAWANLQNLHPFVARHWRKGILGALLILFNSLLGFPQPLITRYIVDDVILGRQLGQRPYDDIDLLGLPRDAARAVGILGDLGYQGLVEPCCRLCGLPGRRSDLARPRTRDQPVVRPARKCPTYCSLGLRVCSLFVDRISDYIQIALATFVLAWYNSPPCRAGRPPKTLIRGEQPCHAQHQNPSQHCCWCYC